MTFCTELLNPLTSNKVVHHLILITDFFYPLNLTKNDVIYKANKPVKQS